MYACMSACTHVDRWILRHRYRRQLGPCNPGRTSMYAWMYLYRQIERERERERERKRVRKNER